MTYNKQGCGLERAKSATEDNAAFVAFKNGLVFTRQDLQEALQSCRIEASIERIRYGYFRKVTATVLLPSNETKIAKLALDPYSVTLLRQESKGYSALSGSAGRHYKIPGFQLVHDSPEMAIALIDYMEGDPIRYWNFPGQTMTQLCGIKETMKVSEYLAVLLSSVTCTETVRAVEPLTAKILRNSGDTRIPLTSSHGDFIHWNVLRESGGKQILIDFEYFSPLRPALFDDWHWFILPMVRKIRSQWVLLPPSNAAPRALVFLLRSFLRRRYTPNPDILQAVKGSLDVLMVLYLFEQTLTLAQEHAMPNIMELIGEDALVLRKQVINIYQEMIGAIYESLS